MVETLRRQFDKGAVSRGELALQEAALAQTVATLPPLRKALQQNRDLLSAVAGAYRGRPAANIPARRLDLPTELPLGCRRISSNSGPTFARPPRPCTPQARSVGVATGNMLPSFTISGNPEP